MLSYKIHHNFLPPSLSTRCPSIIPSPWERCVSIRYLLIPTHLGATKDGADLLSLSKQYNVHISFSAHPLSLKVEGLRGALDRLSKHIVEFKKVRSVSCGHPEFCAHPSVQNIEEKIFMLPAKKAISPDLLQRISRLSGAFTENLGGGLVCL